MNNYLDILTEAIQDTGYWRWWIAPAPEVFQTEFAAVQLWNPPQSMSAPPSNILALRFTGSLSVTFLTFKDAPASLPADWPDQLQKDTIKPPSILNDTLTFNKASTAKELLQNAKVVDTRVGYSPESEQLAASPVLLSFRAGEVGLIVASQNLIMLSSQGKIEPEEIKGKHDQWWAYWQEYWKLRDTKNALPKDYVCEVTIPTSK